LTGRTERTSAAQAILAIPLFNELMDELETYEINCAVAAPYENHETRQGHMAALRWAGTVLMSSALGGFAHHGPGAAGDRAGHSRTGS